MSDRQGGSVFRDTRDLTPFRPGRIRTPVRGFAEGVGEAVSGVLGGRAPGLIGVVGEVPKLKRRAGQPAKAVHDAVFASAEPDRLIALAYAYPGWAGLCQVMAGLIAYKHGNYLRASELLQRGLANRIDDAASQFSAAYLGGVVTRVEVAERVDVPVLFSEESVFLALAHSLREMGLTEAALDAVSGLPPSLPSALARCTAAAALGYHADVVDWTEGLLNTDDLSAALLLIRARSLRVLGEHGAAQAALKEVLRRRKTSLPLRNEAVADRALLAFDVGRRTFVPRPQRRSGFEGVPGIKPLRGIRRDAEMRRLWENDWKHLSGD